MCTYGMLYTLPVRLSRTVSDSSGAAEPAVGWPIVFSTKQKRIVKLWVVCVKLGRRLFGGSGEGRALKQVTNSRIMTAPVFSHVTILAYHVSVSFTGPSLKSAEADSIKIRPHNNPKARDWYLYYESSWHTISLCWSKYMEGALNKLSKLLW